MGAERGSSWVYHIKNVKKNLGKNARKIENKQGTQSKINGRNIEGPEKLKGRSLRSIASFLSVTTSNWPTVTLSNGDTIETRLIVGADGANSAARAAAGIRTVDFDYGQLGVVATLRLEQV